MPRRHTHAALAALLVAALGGSGAAIAQNTSNDRANRGAVPADAGVRPGGEGAMAEQHVLIAHGLEMAIEGSTLQALAGDKASGGDDKDQAKQGDDKNADDSDPAASLARDARVAFDGADRMFREAGEGMKAAGVRGGSVKPDAKDPGLSFYTYANEYASTLRRLGSQKGGDAKQTAQVAAVNHAVKQAIDAYLLKEFSRAAHTSGEAGRALMKHAAEMHDQSLKCVEKLDKQGAVDREGGKSGDDKAKDGGAVEASAQTLAHQAHRVVSALDFLSANDDAAARGLPDGTRNARPRQDR